MSIEEIQRREGHYLSKKHYWLLNDWFRSLLDADNNVMMAATERARPTILRDCCEQYKLPVKFDTNLSRLSAVRKEVSRQKRTRAA